MPEFAGFAGPDPNQNVLNLSNVAWRNIHVVAAGVPPPGKIKLGNIVVANHMERVIRTQVGLEMLDAAANPTSSRRNEVWITATRSSLERLREHLGDPPFLELLQDDTFHLVNVNTGIPKLDLRPGEVLEFSLQCVPHRQTKGYAIRATQFALEGASRRTIGGQRSWPVKSKDSPPEGAVLFASLSTLAMDDTVRFSATPRPAKQEKNESELRRRNALSPSARYRLTEA